MPDTMTDKVWQQDDDIIHKNAASTAILREAQDKRLACYLQCGGEQDYKAELTSSPSRQTRERYLHPRIVGGRSLIVTAGC